MTLFLVAAVLAVTAAPLSASAVATGALSGVVRFGDTSQLVGAGDVAVSYLPWSASGYGSEVQAGTTAADGSYLISGLNPGQYVVHLVDAHGSGYQDAWVGPSGWTPFKPVNPEVTNVVADQTTAEHLAYLGRYGTVSGHVTFESGGVATAGAVHIEVQVERSDTNAWVSSGEADTDASGNYSINTVMEQVNGPVYVVEYRLIATPTDPSSRYVPYWYQWFSLDSPHNITVPFGAVVSGHVDLGVSGTAAGAGQVTVSLANGGFVKQTTTTDAKGNFSFGDVVSAPYTVAYTTPDGSYERRVTSTFNVAGADLALPPVVLAPLVTIHGTVTDSNGAALTGVEVSAFAYDSFGNYLQTFTATTDGSGDYGFTQLPRGQYGLEFHDPTGVHATMEWQDISPYYVPDYLDGTAGAQFTDIDTVLPAAAHIKGVVHGPPASDLVGGHVSAEVEVLDYYPEGAPVWFETGDVWPVAGDGSYDIGDLPPGDDYRVRFTDDLGTACAPLESSTITPAAGATVTYSATLSCRVLSGNQQYVMALYQDYLGRAPSTGDLNYWAGALGAGAPRSSIANGFVTSDEYRLIRIDAAYQTILGRSADAGGRLWWLNQMRSGAISADAISLQFYASQEYVNLAPHGPIALDPTYLWVQELYVDLLHRAPEDSGNAYWALQASIHGRQYVVNTFWNQPETAGERVSAMYASYLGRAPDAGGLAYWTSVDIAYGDSAARGTITSLTEYYNRAQTRVF